MLLGELDLDGSKVSKTFQKLEGGVPSLIGKLGSIGGPLALLGGAAAATAFLVAGFKQTLDMSGELADMSTRTGESAGNLTILREAFKQAGLGADGVEGFFLKLQNAMGGVNERGEKTSAAFEALGVSVESLKGMDGIGQLEALQKGFAGIEDQATKTQVAMNIFGKSGGKALSLLGDSGGLASAKKSAGPSAQLMQENIGNFDRLGDSLGALKLDFTEFFGGALSNAAPALTTLAEKFGEIDFRGAGEALGAVVGGFTMLVGVLSDYVFPVVNGISGALHGIFGSSAAGAPAASDKVNSLGEDTPKKAAHPGAVSALQRLGLGGNFGTGGGDPLLSESRKTNQLLDEIKAQLRGEEKGSFTRVPSVSV